MKITHATSRRMSEGENSRLAALLGGLSERFEVGLIAPLDSELFSLLDGTRVKLTPLKSLGERGKMTTDIYKFSSAIRSDKPHIVHTHGSDAAAVAARACGVKFLVSEGRERAGRLFSSLVNFTVCPSECEAVRLVGGGLSPSRIGRVGCGVPELSHAEGEEGVTVVSKCLLPDEYRLVISALGRVRTEGVRAMLFVAEEELHAASRLAALACPMGNVAVRARGELSSYTPPLSSVFVYPVSSDARLPLLPLRFMSAGIPVVASDTAANREFFSEGGGALRFSSGDPFSLAAALSSLVFSQERREALSLAARATWERRYSPENMIEDYSLLYRALARVGKIR